MIDYNKDEIRNQLDLDDYFQLLIEFGGNPEYSSFGILSETICHNSPGEGSKKLYFYKNSGLFQCYTGCGSFDVFQLVIKVAKIQWNEDYDLNDAVRWIARRFGISGTSVDDDDLEQLEDWKLLASYDRIKDIELQIKTKITLKEYDKNILDKFNYRVNIEPWLKEGIKSSIMKSAKIGFYPGDDQITIPHFDIDGRFIGLRGRSLCIEEAERYGKYRPLRVGKNQYNHPLGMNLYGLNWSKDMIKIMGKAIVFESER